MTKEVQHLIYNGDMPKCILTGSLEHLEQGHRYIVVSTYIARDEIRYKMIPEVLTQF